MRKLAALSFASVLMLPAATRIDDPKTFVTEVYRRLVANSKYDPPDDIYTARLAKLFREDKERSKGEVGCLEFDFWVNGQDFKLSNVTIASADQGDDRKMVVAKFRNLGTSEEIHFTFRREAGRWLLDEAESVMAEKWTLSKILKCTP